MMILLENELRVDGREEVRMQTEIFNEIETPYSP
jgi:hypothetical protein